MSTLSREAWKIVHRKLKYAEKTLSDQAILDTVASISSNFDLYSTLFHYTLSTSLFSSLVIQLLFGIPLSEIGNFFDFKIELPTPEEHVKGLLLRIEVVNKSKDHPETKTTEGLLSGVLSNKAYENYVKNKIEKGVYGKSRYNYSYYDPPVVYEFIRSTLLRITLEDLENYTASTTTRAFVETLGLSPQVIRDVYDRIQVIKQLRNYCVVGSSRLGSCVLPEEDDHGGWLKYVDMDGNISKINAETVVDISGGCILGKSIISQCFLFDGKESLRKDENKLIEILNEMVRSANSRLITTPLIVANYQKADELVYPQRSIRTEHFGLSISRNAMIKTIVDGVIGDRVLDPHTKNLYYVAVMDLFGKITRPRGWGNEAYRVLTRDELLSTWRMKWVSQGLDGSLLEELFTVLYDSGIINNIKNKREIERELVRLSRGESI